MTNRDVVRRLLAAIRPYRHRAFFSLLAMMGTASTQPMLTYAMQLLFDNGFSNNGGPSFPLWMVPAVLVSIFTLRGVFTFSTAYLNNWVLSRVLNDLRRVMFDRLLRMPAARFQQESTGGMINTMIADVRQVVDMISSVFLAFVRDSLTVVALLAMMLWIDWRLTLVALVVVPATAVIVRFTMSRVRRLNRDNIRVTAEMTQVVEEAARGYQVIRLFAGERYERARFEQRSEAMRGYAQRITVAAAATVPITQIATAVAVSVVVLMALHLAQRGEMTVGGFTAFITNMLMLLAPLKALVEVNGPLQRGLAAAETVFAMMDAPPEEDRGTRAIERARGALRFDRVTFSYQGRERPALDGVTLDVAAGETVALVGMSGGGKSTLVQLAARFYAPDAGTVSLDGIPYDDLKLDSLRAQLAMVGQNVVLFDDTLRANIAYGVEQVDEARLARAVRAAHLEQVVAGLPQGLDTPLGENGSRLSGGQRQRVAIARAIYKDAPVLILDEATSALDTESERAVQAALDELMRGRTTLVIAHRLSTIERADRIVVLEHGRIVEAGTHAELLARQGAYANLYNMQFAAEAAAEGMSASRILVVSPNWIGDAVMAQPLLALLRERYPGQPIDVLAPPAIAPAWRAVAEVDAVIEAAFRRGSLELRARWRCARMLRARGYAAAYVLPNTIKFALIPWMAGIARRVGYLGEKRYGLLNVIHREEPGTPRPMVPFYAALAHPPAKDAPPAPRPRLRVTPAEVATAREAAGLPDAPYVVFAPGAEFGPAKRWPAAHFAALAAEVARERPGTRVALLGSPKDKEACDEIARLAGDAVHNLAGATSLGQAIALIAGARAMVANDSGLLHVASALNRPVVALYGPTDPDHAPPFSDAARSLSLRLACAPCRQRTCPLGHHACMVDLLPKSAFQALRDITSM